MKIGNRVSIKPGFIEINLMDGKTGTVIREDPSKSNTDLMLGKSSWAVQFDEPVVIFGSKIEICSGLREEDLELISA